MIRLFTKVMLVVCASMLAACGGRVDAPELYSGPNPFLKYQGEWTEDTGYINLRGQELHVTLEGQVEASEYRIFEAPAEQAQFALINLKKRYSFFMELLAEDATAPEKVEWWVDGQWLDKSAAERVEVGKLKHFRMREINAVVMNSDYRNIQVGKVYEAQVPAKPYSIMEDADDACADYNSHITLRQSTYWYLWNPTKSACPDELSQTMTVTVDELLPNNPESYPEYDQLWADNTLKVAVFFGSLDDGEITEDTNYGYFEKFCQWLDEAGFTETSEPPPEGELPGIRTFEKEAGELSEQVSVIGPHLFEGVNDWGNFDTWQKIVSTHEIIHYDGHSQMGSGMVFEQVDYPEFYQVFQVASCLSYEYYVRPILAGKGNWDSVDVLSNVKSTYYSEGLPLVGAFLAKLFWGFENRGRASWQDIMQAVSNELGHSRFGVSGARGNCFHPDGNLCDGSQPERQRFESTTRAEIPDNDSSGVISQIQIDDSLTIDSLKVELDISHSYIGDLTVSLSHDGVTYALWDQGGGGQDDIRQSFRPSAFDGLEARGSWQLHVVDHANLDQGALNSWALVITPSE